MCVSDILSLMILGEVCRVNLHSGALPGVLVALFAMGTGFPMIGLRQYLHVHLYHIGKNPKPGVAVVFKPGMYRGIGQQGAPSNASTN